MKCMICDGEYNKFDSYCMNCGNKRSLVSCKFDIPDEYKRDICSRCGKIISFGDHKVIIGLFKNSDVYYTSGFGFATHRYCDSRDVILSSEEFFTNLEDSINNLNLRLIKPSSYFLRIIKDRLYFLMYIIKRGRE